MKRRLLVLIIALVAIAAHARAQETAASAPAPLTFSVTYDASVSETFTGRVYLMFAAGPGEPRLGPQWNSPQPFFAKDVRGWKPGEALVFDDSAIAFPAPLSRLPMKDWGVQAVMRRSLDSPSIGDGEGTAYSKTLRVGSPGTELEFAL